MTGIAVKKLATADPRSVLYLDTAPEVLVLVAPDVFVARPQ